MKRTFLDRYGYSAHGSKHSRIYGDFGYPANLDFYFFYNLYRRVGLAFAGVERPVDMTWLTYPKIKLNETDEDEVFNRFARRVRLFPNLKRLDAMQRVGHYAGLVMTVADGKDPKEPLDAESITLDDIVAVTPVWQSQLTPIKVNDDRSSRRYGLPISYQYTGKNGDTRFSDEIHYTRVIIAAEGASGNSIYGESAIEPAFNACLDWEKIRGAGGEGFFKQAAMRGWLQDKTLPGDELEGEGPSEELITEIKESFKEMSESFDSLPYLGGMELKNFTASLANPEHFKNTALEDAAAGFKWSAKGLIGAQEGVMAGDQDSSLDKQTAQSRRENYVSFHLYDIIQWLSDHCKDFQGERIVEWDDLMAPNDKQRLENLNLMQDANQKGVMTDIIPFPDVDELRDIAGYKPLEDIGGFEFDDEDFEDGE